MTPKVTLAAAAMLLAAVPAQADTPGELACIQQGYTSAQTAKLDALLPKLDLLKQSSQGDPVLDAVGELIGMRAAECGAQYEWTEGEVQQALLNEFGRLLEVGFRRHGPFSATQIGKIDAALQNGNRTTLWKALEDQFMKGYADGDTSVSEGNAAILGAFIIETGVGMDVKAAENVGVYLAAKVMQRTSARDFASAQ